MYDEKMNEGIASGALRGSSQGLNALPARLTSKW